MSVKAAGETGASLDRRDHAHGRSRARVVLATASGAAVCAAAIAVGCSSELFYNAEPVEAGADATTSDGASPPLDAMTDAGAVDALVESSVDAGTSGLKCGTQRCAVPDETCCVDTPDAWSLGGVLALAASSGRCVPLVECLAPSLSIRCNSPSSCADAAAGPACCVDHVDDRFTTSECGPFSACDISGPHDVLCAQSNGCPVDHPTCLPYTGIVTFAPFAICQ